jgi:hypothetical protein
MSERGGDVMETVIRRKFQCWRWEWSGNSLWQLQKEPLFLCTIHKANGQRKYKTTFEALLTWLLNGVFFFCFAIGGRGYSNRGFFLITLLRISHFFIYSRTAGRRNLLFKKWHGILKHSHLSAWNLKFTLS